MRLLLDTHIALWAVYDSRKLPRDAVQLLRSPDAEAFVSVASLWEIAIKNSIRQGSLPPTLQARADFSDAGFKELAISGAAMPVVEQLPLHHGDPFDRLLLAQAMTEPMKLITSDRKIARYDRTGEIVVEV